MATAEDGEAEVPDVTDIDEDTLLPIRLKRRAPPVVGDKEKTLSRDTGGMTKAIIYATAGSILKCPVMRETDQAIIAQEVDQELLEYDSYQEEVQSRYGRSPLQLVLDKGKEAYEALQSKFNNNVYLHAAIHEVSVMEAAEELGETPRLVVDVGEGWQKISNSYSDPDIVAASVVGEDGAVHETDLREFTPSLDWVVENWTLTGGSRSVTRALDATEKTGALFELADNTSEGTVRDSVINKPNRNRYSKSYTVHFVRDVEHSIVEEEDSQVVTSCGTPFTLSDKLLRLHVDDGPLQDTMNLPCGNCTSAVQ